MSLTNYRVSTPLLDIAYELSGPEKGAPLVLLHGWPDGVRTWDRILPALHDDGWRTFVPWLRGYGATQFLDAQTPRTGQIAALAQDALDFAHALGLGRFAVVGHDWGARAAYAASCLAPERISHCVAMSVGWATNDPNQCLALGQVQNYWYHWYMALDRGKRLLRNDPEAFTRYIWDIWNPGYTVSDAEFAETARAFKNPDWADVVLHYYRVRWALAKPDPSYDKTEAHLETSPEIAVPTLVLHGGADPCTDPSTTAGQEHLFTGPYRRVVLEGVGHFPQRQAPEAVAGHILEFLAERA